MMSITGALINLATWAVLKSLGRSGVSEMVGRHCAVARRIAARLAVQEGVEVLNEVVLNQVIVEFGLPGDDAEARRLATQDVIERAVAGGQIFVGGAEWHERWVMRISVISQETTVEDGDFAVDVILSAWAETRAK